MCQVYSAQFSALLDTGSARSLIEHSFATKLKLKTKPLTQDQPHNLYNASNEEMPIIGIVEIPLKIGGLIFVQSLLVVNNLSYRCLLGRDFCTAASVHIDFTNQTVSLCDDVLSVNMLQDFKKTFNLISTVNNITLQPNSEHLIAVRLGKPDHSIQNDLACLVYPFPAIEKQQYIVGRSLVKNPGRRSFLIPLINPQNNTVKIKARTPIAQLNNLSPHCEFLPWNNTASPSPSPPQENLANQLIFNVNQAGKLPNFYTEHHTRFSQHSSFGNHTDHTQHHLTRDSSNNFCSLPQQHNMQFNTDRHFTNTISSNPLSSQQTQPNQLLSLPFERPPEPPPIKIKRTLAELNMDLKLDHLSATEQQKIKDLLSEYTDIFALSYADIKGSKINIFYRIHTPVDMPQFIFAIIVIHLPMRP